MKRTKTITLVLVVALVLMAVAAPVVIAQTQFGLAASNAQGSAGLFTIEIGASTPPIAIACGACSGGGTGPE
jgi:cell division protein YceG involved in septum cleavage